MLNTLLTPSLSNYPLFFAIVMSLLLAALLSLWALLALLPWASRARSPALMRAKHLLAWPWWLYVVGWALWLAYLAAMVGGLAGSPVVMIGGPLLLLAGAGLHTWFVWSWTRPRRWRANVVLLAVVAIGAGGVWLWQLSWWCEPLAHSGITAAQMCTAELYVQGEGGAIANEQTARQWYRAAADAGAPRAAVMMAGFSRTPADKERWLRQAADAGDAEAAFGLFQFDRTRLARLQQAVEGRFPPAMYEMGALHLAGDQVPKDLTAARTLWHAAAEAGDSRAAWALANAYAEGTLMVERDAQAAEHWRERGQTLDAAALSAAAQGAAALLRDDALSANFEVAYADAEQRGAAAVGGDGAALLQRATAALAQAGDDPGLRRRAVAMLAEAAEAGEPEAQYRVAMHYFTDANATEQQLEAARSWLRAAADARYLPAYRELIRGLQTGEYGFVPDLAAARTYGDAWIAAVAGGRRGSLQAAQMTHADTLALLEQREQLQSAEEKARADGTGEWFAEYRAAKVLMTTHYAQGVAKLESLADQGYQRAQYEAALRYLNGPRTQAEEAKGLEWIKSAARNGHVGAILRLADIYRTGWKQQGIAPNLYFAKRLYTQALRDGGDPYVFEWETNPGRRQVVPRSTVERDLASIPPSIQRLDLDDVRSADFEGALQRWYDEEWARLLAAMQTAGTEELAELQLEVDLIRMQRDVLMAGGPMMRGV